MTIDVSAPNGASISFPDGTDATTIDAVMRQHFGALSAPAPDQSGFSLGRTVTEPFADIPHEVARTAREGLEEARGGLPASLGGARDMASEDPLTGTLRTGRLLLDVPQNIWSTIFAPAKSVIGHPMASAQHAVGGLIAPDIAAKETPEQLYEDWRPKVDTALTAVAAKGAPAMLRVPELPGPPAPPLALPAAPEAPPAAPSAPPVNLPALRKNSDVMRSPIVEPAAPQPSSPVPDQTVIGTTPPPELAPPAAPTAEPEILPPATVPDGVGGSIPPRGPGAPPPGGASPPPPPGGEGGAQMVRNLSREGRDMLREILHEEGVTPEGLDTIDQNLGQHGMFGEVGPTTQLHMAAIASIPGEAKTGITAALTQRTAAAPKRIDAMLTDVLGPRLNVAQTMRRLDEVKEGAAAKLYDAWRGTPVTPWEGLNKPVNGRASLMDRLEASGALKEANRKMAIAGEPATMQFERLPSSGQLVRLKPNVSTAPEALANRQVVGAPTAQSFDYMKRALDNKIADALSREGGADDARLYGQLKNDLVSAIDNHPDPRVAGVWKAGRQAFAAPARIQDAIKLGQRVLRADIHAEDIPFLTSGFTAPELKAFQDTVRTHMGRVLDATRRGDNVVRNKFLAEGGQEKLRWIYGDDKAQQVIDALNHEDLYAGAPKAIIGGSPTAGRLEAQKVYTPQPSAIAEAVGKIANPANALGPVIGVAGHLAGLGPIPSMALGAATMGVQSLRRRSIDRAFAALRKEIGGVMTLQGADRRGAMAELLRGETPRALPRP